MSYSVVAWKVQYILWPLSFLTSLLLLDNVKAAKSILAQRKKKISCSYFNILYSWQLTGHSAKTALHTFLQSLNGNLENLRFMAKQYEMLFNSHTSFFREHQVLFIASYMCRLIYSSLFVWASLDLLKIMILLFSIAPVKSLSYQMWIEIWELAQLTLISFNMDTFWKQSILLQ